MYLFNGFKHLSNLCMHADEISTPLRDSFVDHSQVRSISLQHIANNATGGVSTDKFSDLQGFIIY